VRAHKLDLPADDAVAWCTREVEAAAYRLGPFPEEDDLVEDLQVLVARTVARATTEKLLGVQRVDLVGLNFLKGWEQDDSIHNETRF
jgi:hypothetical protein